MSAESNSSNEDQIESLLFECLEAQEPTRAIEKAAAEHPQLGEQLRNAYAEMVRFDLVGNSPSGLGLTDSGSSSLPTADAMPERLGDYRLLERLGAGGMGVVFLARDDVLQRTVALKLIRPEHLYMPGARERFQREVETIARLQHPGIVPIYGVGKSDGMPYFTMQHINGCSASAALAHLHERKSQPDGRQLLDFANSKAAPEIPSDAGPDSGSGSGSTHGIDSLGWPETCTSITIQVAGALHHAHERGVLHRDVKPSNILLTREGRAMLVDFGLAWSSDTDQRLTHSTSQLGSIPYLPPEHIEGKAPDPSRAADVYSLGVTLYEMLTLRNPFLGKNGEETRRNILGARSLRLRREQRGVSWELETVCMTAMDPDPSKRYRTMLDFLRDLERVRDRESIAARRPGVLRRSRRWMQRHPTIMAALTVALLGSLAAMAVFGINQKQARVQSDLLREAAEVERYGALVSSADLELRSSSRPERSRRKLSQCREDDRGWEWFHLEYASDQSMSLTDDFAAAVQALTWSPDGETYLVATQDKVLSCRTRQQKELWRQPDLSTSAMTFRTTGARHELICGRLGAELWVHDPASGKPILNYERPDDALVGELTSIVASPDGKYIYTACADGNISAWDAEKREFIKNFGKHKAQAHRIAINNDGTRVATGGFDRTIRVFDTTSLEEIAQWQLGRWCLDLDFTPDGKRLLFVDSNVPQFVDLEQPEAKPQVLDRNTRTSLAIARSPDGKLVCAAVDRRVLHVYRVRSESPLRLDRLARLSGHEGLVQHVSFSPDSQSILTGSTDQTVRIWTPSQCAQIGYRPHRRMVKDIAFVDGGAVVTADSRGNLCAASGDGVFDKLTADGEQAAHEASIVALIPSASGFRSLDEDGRVVTWANEQGSWQAKQTLETALSIGTTAQAAATTIGTADGHVVVFDDSIPPEQWRTWAAHEQRISSMAGHGSTLWTACVEGNLKCWDTATGELLLEGPRHPRWIAKVLVAPNGEWLATSCADTVIRILDAKTGDVLRRLEGHGRVPLAMTTDTNGSRLISGGGFDAEMRFWQPDTGRCLLSMRRPDAVMVLKFDPRKNRLALGGREGAVQLLRIRPTGPRAFGTRPMPEDTMTSPPGGRRFR